MNGGDETIVAPRRAPPAAPKPEYFAVWDAPVRLFHWAVVLLVAGMIWTGLEGGEALLWHMRMGQTLIVLVLFRMIWGFVGSPNARFSSFVRGPAAVLRYARSIVRAPHEIHATHNPLGGWMVIALLVALLVQAGTGLFTNDDILWDGPLASRISKETSDAIASIHRRFWWVLVALAAAHIAAVFFYLLVLKDDLIAAMATGEKVLPPGVADRAGAVASNARALAIVAAVGVAVWFLLHKL